MADGIWLTGDWADLEKALSPLYKHKAEIHRGMVVIGAYVRNEIKKRIKDRKYTANHPFTIREKTTRAGRGDQPLVDTGQLNKSITYKVEDWGLGDVAVFVGIRKETKNKDGEDMVKLGAILHDGVTIEVTPKMRAYLHSRGFHLKPTTTHLVIPPRPFVNDVVYSPKVQAEVRKLYLNMVRSALLAGLK